MTELQVFNHPQFGTVRAVEIQGEPWLVGKDVAESLGYTATEKAIRTHVDGDDKGVTEMDTPRRKAKSSYYQRKRTVQSCVRQ